MAARAVLSAEIFTCANTTASNASVNRLSRLTNAAASGLWCSESGVSDQATIAPRISPTSINALARNPSMPRVDT